MWTPPPSPLRRRSTGPSNDGQRQLTTPHPDRIGGVSSIMPLGLLTAIVLSVLLTTPAHASLASDRAEQYRYALETMNLTSAAYVDRANNFRAYGCWEWYRPGNCRKPLPYNYFEWTTDGCSGPTGRLPPAGSWSSIFNGPCQQHDFGYRNFSKNLTLERTEARRKWIDKRFKTEMDRICSTWPNDTFFDRSKTACYKASTTMYNAVSSYNYWFASWG